MDQALLSSLPRTVKWIDAGGPRRPTREVAGTVLGVRLRPVVEYLPLAAEHSEHDVEFVHQLRVSSRRAVAALRLFEDFVPAKRARWIRRRCVEIREAAGVARDCDVFIARLAGNRQPERVARLLDALSEERATAQRPIVEVHTRLGATGRLDRRIGELLERIRPRTKSARRGRSRFRPWARHRLGKFVDRFFDACPEGLSDLEALHRFRIRGKRLRYAIESLAGAFPAEMKQDVSPAIEKLQDRLGAVNDHVFAGRFIQRHIDAAGSEADRELLAEFLREDTVGLQSALESFAEWWTDRRVRSLKRRFSALLG